MALTTLKIFLGQSGNSKLLTMLVLFARLCMKQLLTPSLTSAQPNTFLFLEGKVIFNSILALTEVPCQQVSF